MSSARPTPPAFLFWQTAVSVLLAVLAGFAFLVFSGKHHAQAISGSLFAGQQSPDGRLPGAVPSLPSLPALDRRLTLLVMGVDSNGKDTERWVGTRSDTMMVVSLDPETKRVGLVSIPRDSRVKIPGHYREKINAAHALGGPELAVATVREVFGVPVDRYVVIDTQGLKKLFEMVGPVEVLVENRMRYRDRAAKLDVDLEPGLQLLDPTQTEEYVRFRHDPRGDIGRIERQQWFLRQLAHKLKEPQVIFKLPQLFGFAQEYVVTDLTMEEMARIAGFAKDIEPDQVTTAMLPGGSATIGGGSYWLPDPAASKVVFERLIGPTISVTGEDGDVVLVASETTVTVDEPSADETASLKPLTIGIKYPRGGEALAANLEGQLERAGFKVRYKWQCQSSECQHEQIVQNSFRADDLQTKVIRDAVSSTQKWPTVVALETRPVVDFTLVISQNSSIVAATASSTARERHPEADLVQ